MPWSGGRNWTRALLALSWQPRPPLARIMAQVENGNRLIDLGAGGRRLNQSVVTVDGVTALHPDVVADCHHLPFQSETLHWVVCTGTLEHVERPAAVLEEVRRVLKPGGRIYLEVPFLQVYHPDPGDYWRWTLSGLRLICRQSGFKELESGVHMGPSSALASICDTWLGAVLGPRMFRRPARAVARPFLALAKYVDWVCLERPLGRAAASGVYYLGAKE